MRYMYIEESKQSSYWSQSEGSLHVDAKIQGNEANNLEHSREQINVQ